MANNAVRSSRESSHSQPPPTTPLYKLIFERSEFDLKNKKGAAKKASGDLEKGDPPFTKNSATTQTSSVWREGG
jgi:hypothetical protein